MNEYNNSPLGQKSAYADSYDPTLLFPIARLDKRREIGADTPGLFFGVDIWNAYEISFLSSSGKPEVGLGVFIVPADSPFIIESKSMKLYLNSFNNSRYETWSEVSGLITADLSAAVGKPVDVRLTRVRASHVAIDQLRGHAIDDTDVECNDLTINKERLVTSDEQADEALVSHLLKSNCLVTGQPDWASLRITYQGKKIDRAGLLQYIVSFRNHNEFHEQCVERIYCDIMQRCEPAFLIVEARYTRRGGIDINPCRASEAGIHFENPRLARQ